MNKAFTAIREVELDEVLERERMKREVSIIVSKISHELSLLIGKRDHAQREQRKLSIIKCIMFNIII